LPKECNCRCVLTAECRKKLRLRNRILKQIFRVPLQLRSFYFRCTVFTETRHRLWDPRFSRWCLRRLKSSGMWHCVVGRIGPEICNEYCTYAFSQVTELCRLSTNIKTQWSFRTLGFTQSHSSTSQMTSSFIYKCSACTFLITIKIFNNLPHKIKDLAKDILPFQKALKRFLLANSFFIIVRNILIIGDIPL